MTPKKYRNKEGKEFWLDTTNEQMKKQGQLYPDCHKPTHEEMIEYGYYKEITLTPTDTQKIGTEWVYDNGECWLGVIDKTAEEIAAELLTYVNIKRSEADQLVGEKRTKWLTSTQLQDITYSLKSDEAAAHKAAGYPPVDSATYPYIYHEMLAMQVKEPTTTPQQASDSILAQSGQFQPLGAYLEGLRRTTKEKLDIARSKTECDNIMSILIGTLGAI